MIAHAVDWVHTVGLETTEKSLVVVLALIAHGREDKRHNLASDLTVNEEGLAKQLRRYLKSPNII